MDFKEFSEDYLGKVVNIGDEVWICDYRHDNINNQPIRNVVPQKVVIEDNNNLPKNKRVYYSNVHFLPVGVNGKPKKQVIAPFDNTGYRGYTGVSVQIFLTENECRAAYIKQCETIKAQIKEARDLMNARFDAMEQGLAEKIKDYA